MEHGTLIQTIDIRYPTTTTWKAIHQTMQAHALAADATLSVEKASDPFYMDEQYPPLQACLTAYNTMMHRAERPEVIGGTTYSRLFSHAIGFGMDDMNEEMPAFVGMLHGPDEGFSINQFKIGLRAYILALMALDHINYEEI